MKYNLSQIMKDAHALYNNKFQRQGRTFGQCLSCAWRWAKNDLKALAEREERIKKYQAEGRAQVEANKNKANPYNDVNIPASAFYSDSKGYMGAHFCND